MSRSTKTFYIENLGCAKNQVDAETLMVYLEEAGWQSAASPEEAGYLIINSCGFIRSAKEESIQAAYDLRRSFPDKKIILAGCLAQRYGRELSGLFGTVDGIFGNRALSLIPEYLSRGDSDEFGISLEETDSPVPMRRRLFSYPGSAYLKISEGCDNRCSFCAIPLIRGPLRSRDRAEILREIRHLLDMGIFEINLVGQDLGSYGIDRGSGRLIDLLTDISALSGDFWIRLLYIHPDHFPREILGICASDERILPYFDIPFQHASKRILSGMGRKGDSGSYLSLAREIRDTLPRAVLRTTFLTGFPGEGRSDFRTLREFQAALRSDWLGVFAYSREEGTPAASGRRRLFPTAGTAAKRRDILMNDQMGITEENMRRFKGLVLPVLLEERVEGEELALGRIYAQAPEVDGLTVLRSAAAQPGGVVLCRITGINGYDLSAEPVG